MTPRAIKTVADRLWKTALRYPKCFRIGEKKMLQSILVVEAEKMRVDKCEKFIRACWEEHCPGQEMPK